MNYDILVDLLTNMVLVVSMSVIYSLFDGQNKLSKFSSKIVMGVFVAGVGYVVMRNNVEIEPGIVFDGRSLVMVLAGFYFGLIPALLGGIVLIYYRIIIGGNGMIPGLLWVVIPAAIGLLWRYYRLKKYNLIKEVSKREQFIVIFFTQFTIVGILFLFPNKVSLDAIKQIVIPIVFFYPIGGFIVSTFMLRIRQNYFDTQLLKKREDEYIGLFNQANTSSFIVDSHSGKIINVNQVAITKYGYSFEEFTQKTIKDLSILGELDISNAISHQEEYQTDYIISKSMLKSGGIIDVEVRLRTIQYNEQEYIYVSLTDITKRLINEQKYQDVNEKLKATLHSVGDGVIVTNQYGYIEVINEVAQAYLTVSDNFVGKNLFQVIRMFPTPNQLPLKDLLTSIVNTKTAFKTDKPYIVMDRNDETHYLDFTLSPVIYQNESFVKGSILVFRDITEAHIAQNKIEYVSQHDFLTELYNRYFLETEMKRLDTERQLPITLIIGDVNGLKLVNDTFGHIVGDQYLKEVSDIIKKATRAEDITARWGGDEFMILLPQTTKENAEIIVQRISDLSKKSRFELFVPSLSLGVATKEDSDIDLNDVLKKAEDTMYTNKILDGKIMRQELLDYIKNELSHIHPDLGSHGQRVYDLSLEFASYINLDKETTKDLLEYAKYHDIGWITANKKLIDTKTSLIKQDIALNNNFSEVGFRIMKSFPELAHLADYIGNHKVKWDGTGQDSLSNDDIPIVNRILSIIDRYDVYKIRQFDFDYIINKLEELSGKKTDPNLTLQFIEFIKKRNR